MVQEVRSSDHKWAARKKTEVIDINDREADKANYTPHPHPQTSNI